MKEIIMFEDNTPIKKTNLTLELPTRFDEEYIRINQFEKYEYTHCIAYEFARRNDNVANILNLLHCLFAYYEQILPKMKILKENENIKNKLSNIVNVLTKELYDKYYIIYQYQAEGGSNKFNEIYNPSLFLSRDDELTKYVEDTYGDEVELKKSNSINCESNIYFTVLQDVYTDKKAFKFNTIYPNFSTALRDFADTKIALNLSLPKDEIMDYVEKIKDDYDNENSIIKTPMQILEESCKKYDASVDITESEKWADYIFIYDYYYIYKRNTDKKEHEIIKKIQIELTKFHGLKVRKNPEEIKNKKDTLFKKISWEEYIKENPETNEENIYFNENTKAYWSTKSIVNKYKVMQSYIEGDNPKYKVLIDKSLLNL